MLMQNRAAAELAGCDHHTANLLDGTLLPIDCVAMDVACRATGVEAEHEVQERRLPYRR